MVDKSELLNGAAEAPAIDAAKQVFRADPGLVALAQRLLDDAKSGRITTMAAIVVAPTGHMQWPAYGTQAPELYLGAGLFQRGVEGAVTGAGRSKIIRPNG